MASYINVNTKEQLCNNQAKKLKSNQHERSCPLFMRPKRCPFGGVYGSVKVEMYFETFFKMGQVTQN